MPWVVKLENKAVGLATKGWDKLRNSEMSVNKKVVSFVRRLLNTIPYEENCLRSFPSSAAMVREINNEKEKGGDAEVATSAEIATGAVELSQLKPIPVFHPRFQSPLAVLDQLHQLRTATAANHKKYAVLCAIGIPLSLPFALVPVLPNVPGFYLAYRLYCHVKALYGIHNLGYLLETATKTDYSVLDTTHLDFVPLPSMDQPYLGDGEFAKVLDELSDDAERVLLTGRAVDALVEHHGIPHLRDELNRAVEQETARLAAPDSDE